MWNGVERRLSEHVFVVVIFRDFTVFIDWNVKILVLECMNLNTDLVACVFDCGLDKMRDYKYTVENTRDDF